MYLYSYLYLSQCSSRWSNQFTNPFTISQLSSCQVEEEIKYEKCTNVFALDSLGICLFLRFSELMLSNMKRFWEILNTTQWVIYVTIHGSVSLAICDCDSDFVVLATSQKKGRQTHLFTILEIALESQSLCTLRNTTEMTPVFLEIGMAIAIASVAEPLVRKKTVPFLVSLDLCISSKSAHLNTFLAETNCTHLHH